MIERYSRPQMKIIWSDENKFNKWLEVEIAVCDTWAELGIIPRQAAAKIKLAKCSLKRMGDILKETHHDMTAFLGAVSESLGDESRFVHMGLTSSDVIDTGLSLQMVEAVEILSQDVKELISVLAQKAIEHKYTPMMGRTHGVHAEPISFGLKLALWTEEMRRNQQRLTEAKKGIAAGKISGAVGTYATVPPEVEEKACAKLGLAPAPVSNQVLQRDRHAQFITTLAIVASSLAVLSGVPSLSSSMSTSMPKMVGYSPLPPLARAASSRDPDSGKSERTSRATSAPASMELNRTFLTTATSLTTTS